MSMKSFILMAVCCVIAGTSCKKKDDLSDDVSTLATGKHLFVASGVCYAGAGNTTFTNLTASNIVYAVDLTTGSREGILADYNSTPSNYGDSPVGLVSADG